MNSKKTKGALFSSVIALMLCFSMLLGTTFAWFTDSVTSTNNIIKSGTLDVEMTWANKLGGVYKDASEGAIFNYQHWEPGYTDIKYVKIANVGNLAFKYQLNVIPTTVAAEGEVNLADVIDVYMLMKPTVDVTRENMATTMQKVGTLADLMADVDGAAHGILIPAEGKIAPNFEMPAEGTYEQGEFVVGIALKMQESAGNEYQDLTIGGSFSVQLLATQYTYETDSFGNDYDEDAAYPTVVASANDLVEAMNAGGNIVLATDIDLSETVTVASDVTLDLNGKTLNASANSSRPFTVSDGASLTIEAEGAEIDCGAYGLVNMTEGTLTINGGTFTNEVGNNGAFIRVSGDEEMVINLNDVTYKAVTTDSGVIRTSGSNVTVNVVGGTYEAGMGFLLENGSITGANITATNTANMWPAVYADGEVTVSGSTIKSACHAIAVGGGNTVTVENCDVQPAEGKLAFQVFSSGGTIKVINCTYTGSYGTTGKINSGCPDAVIIIDGAEVYRKSAQ